MQTPISRCLVEATSVTRDKYGNLAITLQRGPFESDETDVVEMTPNGDQPIIMRIRHGVHLAIEPGRHYYLDLTPVVDPESSAPAGGTPKNVELKQGGSNHVFHR